MSDWSSLKLVAELHTKNPSLHARLTTVADYVKPLLAVTRPIGSEEFTDHDFAHSTRIAHRIAQILPSSCALNGTELYLLLLAVLLHDSGMWGPKEEVLKLPDDPTFRKWAECSHSQSWKQVQEDLAFEPRRWMGEMGLRHLAAIWFRITHPARLGSFVFDPKSPTGSTLRVLIGDNFIPHVATIAEAHSWDRTRVLDDSSLDPQEIVEEPVNLRFLAKLLRLGDLLDLGEGRISTLLWDYLRPLNAVSEMHWRKEHTLRVRNCSAKRIEVAGDFDIDSGGLTTSEAYRLALEWLALLEAEIKDCALVDRTDLPDEYASRCRLGDLKFDCTLVKANGLVTGEKIAFELNRRRILELLGDEIYSTGSVFVRELLQNALDATRAQIVRDHHREMQDDPVTYPPDRPWDWPHSVTGTEHYAIDVNVTEEKDTRGRDLILFTVTDRGTGMTLKQIKNHFLQVGVSYYQSDQFKTEFRFKPISRFGIGFLSCLTVAQPEGRIEVLTRAASEPAGLRLTIQLPSDQYLITKDEALPQGTTVKVWIDPAADHPPGWDSPPIDDWAVGMAAGLPNFDLKAASQMKKLEVSITQWLLFSEVTLLVNGEKHLPRRIEPDANARRVVEHPFHESPGIELHIRMESGTSRLLGQGFWFKRGFRSGLPMTSRIEEDENKHLHSHRSIVVETKGSPYTSFLVWNSIRLPRRSLSASRLVRGDSSPLGKNWTRWRLMWFAHLYSELMKRSPELASVWRWLVYSKRELSEEDRALLPPLRYPVRVGHELRWETKESIAELGPVLLVPFGIAWHQAISTNLPLVGLPDFSDGSRVWHDQTKCRLVRVEDECTGLLWPPDAKTKRLPWFTRGATFLARHQDPKGPTIKGASDLSPLRLGDVRSFPLHTLDSSDLPAYDRTENPWEVYSLTIFNGPDVGFSGTLTGKRANELLHNTPPIHTPEELLRVVIPDGDEWE